MLLNIIQIIKWPVVFVVVLIVILILFRNLLGLFVNQLLRIKPQNKADMFEKVGRIYASMKLYDLAAEAFKSAGKYEEAGDHLTMAKKPLAAAQAFEKAGNLVKANTARAEYYGGAGEFQKAAEMFEKAGEYELSAQMYENAHDLQHAAVLYQRAGNLEKAKQLPTFIDDEKKTTGTLLKEKNFIETAEEYIKLGDIDSAIESLQKVTASDEDEYYNACVLLGNLFVNKGMFVPAIEKYKKAIGNKLLNKDTVGAYYGIATAMERTGEISKALLIYDRVLAEDYNYKDVRVRIERLKKLPSKQQIKAAEGIRYSIIKEIGRGSMGKVYEAYDTVLERRVAYKVPSLDLTHHPALVNDFLREAKSAAALNHPNIVIVYDTGKQGEDYYIAMELLSGETLKDNLVEKGHLSVSEALKISEQLARALVYAHSKNLIHRDVKPGNIMLTDEDIVKLMDFGLAKIIYDTAQNTTKIIGTPYYMSPEQIQGDKINFETDIYSFGAVLYETITGTPPFSKGDIYYHHMHSPAPSLKSVMPSISDKVDALIKKCLQKEPERRFPSTSELLAGIISLRHETIMPE